MNARENMIVAKERIITTDVKSCVFNRYTRKYDITFHNGKTYSYAAQNVVWMRGPEIIDISACRILYKERELFNIREVYRFVNGKESFLHVVFKGGTERDYRGSDLKLLRCSCGDGKSKNVFEYLKHIADAVSLQTEDGVNLLARQYDRIESVERETALWAYLNPESYKNAVKSVPVLIFPFGCNASQYKAVKTAMENQISVIQGPPGTGKTQTILNIAANLLLQGKTVQVVSNNNAATDNVFEKLSDKECGLGFLAAPLGKKENKERFIRKQTGQKPDLSGWNSNSDPDYLKTELEAYAARLQNIYTNQERLASVRRDRQALDVEYSYFKEYYDEKHAGIGAVPTKRRLSAVQIMEFWQELRNNMETDRALSFFLKLKYFIKYGISGRLFYRLDISDMVAAVQHMYYERRLDELKAEIQSRERFLSKQNAEELRIKYTEISMRCLRQKLYKKYGYEKTRKIFTAEDIRKNGQDFQKEYPVVLSTTYSARNSLGKDDLFDYVIMDEASQVDVVTGALALSCARNAVIVGDEKQLPNVVTRATEKTVDGIFESFHVSECYRFSKNSFLKSVRLCLPAVPQTLLREHYRCHPKIIGFCNQKFYHGDLLVMTEDHGEPDVISVIRTVAGNHGCDRMNQRQIEAVTQEILPEVRCKSDEIGIIAPYNKQVDALRDNLRNTDMDIATVHKFQGREKDTIILTTVDDEATDFSDDPYLLNVAVSRAKKHLYLVVSGNEGLKDSNIGDLIAYIEYNNFQIRQSRIYSVFDYLYKQYTDFRRSYLEKYKEVSEYDSENLMFALIDEVLHSMPEWPLDAVCHMPLNMLIRDFSLMNDDERRYAANNATHVDFLIYNKVSKKPVLAIEVDGFHYHKEGTAQAERDKKKNRILELYKIPYIRFATNGSGEKEKLISKLNLILNGQ